MQPHARPLHDDLLEAPSADDSIRLERVTKRFGAQLAVDGVDLTLAGGKVHVLLGHNGSGKSTIVKLLTGYHRPDSGSIWIWDTYAEPPIRHPRAFGIAVVHQDLGLFPTLSVLENFGVDDFVHRYHQLKPLSWSHERQQFLEYCELLGVAIPADKRISELQPAQQASLAIVRALRTISGGSVGSAASAAGHRRLLILDEATANLGRSERPRLRALIRDIAAGGAAVLMVTHDMSDVFQFGDEVVVMRDGRVARAMPVAQTSAPELVQLITGKSQTSSPIAPLPPERQPGRRVLKFEGVSAQTARDVTLAAHSGEVMGLTGLPGSGWEECAYLAAGVRSPLGGTVSLQEQETTESFGKKLQQRVRIVPGDRLHEGVWLDGNVQENLMMGHMHANARFGLVRWRHVARRARLLMKEFHVNPPTPAAPITALSGGNQQKVVLARALQRKPDAVVLYEPTQGVDVGVAEEILTLIRMEASRGMIVLIASLDLEFLVRACDHVAVFRGGRPEQLFDSKRRVFDAREILWACEAIEESADHGSSVA